MRVLKVILWLLDAVGTLLDLWDWLPPLPMVLDWVNRAIEAVNNLNL